MNLRGRSVLTPEKTPNIVDADRDAPASVEPAIGMAVTVAAVDGEPAHGVIVDDFGDLAGTSVEIGTERVARARRWAVDIDGGHIVFVDEFLSVRPAQTQY